MRYLICHKSNYPSGYARRDGGDCGGDHDAHGGGRSEPAQLDLSHCHESFSNECLKHHKDIVIWLMLIVSAIAVMLTIGVGTWERRIVPDSKVAHSVLKLVGLSQNLIFRVNRP